MEISIEENQEQDEFDPMDSKFLEIPEEMFLYICSFADIKDILTLKLVCKKFYFILQDDKIFKTLLATRWNGSYAIPIDEDSEWKRICYYLEKENKEWSKKFTHKILKDQHISNVDAVLLLEQGARCLSGSRDRSLVLWQIPEDPSDSDPTVLHSKVVHEGWVWRLREINGSLYSASWDNTIKQWDCTCDILEKQIFKCLSSVLCLTSDMDGLIYGGTFMRNVVAFDPRTSPEPVFTYSVHRSAVLTLDSIGNDVISGSEDKSLAVYDKRMGKIRQQVKFTKLTYPRTSQTLDKYLFFGDNVGHLSIYSIVGGDLKLKNSLDFDLPSAITTLNVSHGLLKMGTASGIGLVFLALYPPQMLMQFQPRGGIVCGMDSGYGRMVIGASSSVEFWLPLS